MSEWNDIDDKKPKEGDYVEIEEEFDEEYYKTKAIYKNSSFKSIEPNDDREWVGDNYIHYGSPNYRDERDNSIVRRWRKINKPKEIENANI